MNTYLLIDYANLFNRMKHVTMRGADAEERAALVIHQILNGIRSAWMKQTANHVVVCLEGKSWRKKLYPEYKMNRVTKKLKMTPKEIEVDELFQDYANEFATFLKEKTMVSVIQSKNAEADDIIATFIHCHPDDKHVIVSTDSDFHQLISDNVTMYDPMKQYNITINGIFDEYMRPVLDKQTKKQKTIGDPEYVLFKKCIRGDSSDNIKSSYPRLVEKSTKNRVGIDKVFNDRHTRGYDWITVMLHEWEDHKGQTHIVKEDFERNMKLIDLTQIPLDVRDEILVDIGNEISKPPRGSKIGFDFNKFCKKHELEAIREQLNPYALILSKGYPRQGN